MGSRQTLKSEGPSAFPPSESMPYLLDNLGGHSHKLAQIHWLARTLKRRKVKVRQAWNTRHLEPPPTNGLLAKGAPGDSDTHHNTWL